MRHQSHCVFVVSKCHIYVEVILIFANLGRACQHNLRQSIQVLEIIERYQLVVVAQHLCVIRICPDIVPVEVVGQKLALGVL